MKTRKIVAIPGPTPVVKSIQEQMGREIQAFGDPRFLRDYKEVISDMKRLWDTDGQVFVIAGTGTLAMEMAVANTLQEGDNILIVSHGYFGDRFIEICERKRINVDVIHSEWGRIVPVEEIDKKLSEKSYQAITVSKVSI